MQRTAWGTNAQYHACPTHPQIHPRFEFTLHKSYSAYNVTSKEPEHTSNHRTSKSSGGPPLLLNCARNHQERLRLRTQGGNRPSPHTAGRRFRRGQGVASRPAQGTRRPRAHIPQAGVTAPHSEAERRGQGKTAQTAPHLCGPARDPRGGGKAPTQRGSRAESGREAGPGDSPGPTPAPTQAYVPPW